VRHHLTRDHLSAICALVHNGRQKGRLLVQVRDKAFCGQSMIGFLLHLLRHLKGKLLVIWDGAPIHRSKAVQAFLASPAARRLRVERLPGYAPELNPVEAVWQYLKRVELRNLCCNDLVHLRTEWRKAVARLRHKTKVLLGCLCKPRLI
jgi:putative transposase